MLLFCFNFTRYFSIVYSSKLPEFFFQHLKDLVPLSFGLHYFWWNVQLNCVCIMCLFSSGSFWDFFFSFNLLSAFWLQSDWVWLFYIYFAYDLLSSGSVGLYLFSLVQSFKKLGCLLPTWSSSIAGLLFYLLFQTRCLPQLGLLVQKWVRGSFLPEIQWIRASLHLQPIHQMILHSCRFILLLAW